MEAQSYALRFLKDIDDSMTHYHAVEVAKWKLKDAGFQELQENQPWNLIAGGNYYCSRNMSALMAFRMPPTVPETGGIKQFKIVGTHTDSPVLRLAPKSKLDQP